MVVHNYDYWIISETSPKIHCETMDNQASNNTNWMFGFFKKFRYSAMPSRHACTDRIFVRIFTGFGLVCGPIFFSFSKIRTRTGPIKSGPKNPNHGPYQKNGPKNLNYGSSAVRTIMLLWLFARNYLFSPVAPWVFYIQTRWASLTLIHDNSTPVQANMLTLQMKIVHDLCLMT